MLNATKSNYSIDLCTIEGFGKEWKKFNHLDTPDHELRSVFESYFSNFPWDSLPETAVGFDLGCGSGRWAYFVAPRVGVLHCIDPSVEALERAKIKLREFSNCRFHLAAAASNPLPDNSADFGYSIGVLHHVSDTQAGLNHCVRKLKAGAPFLVYLYYAFDNRPFWFRYIWKLSDLLRQVICWLPFNMKSIICEVIAAFVYWPMARFARICELILLPVSKLPLSAYRDRDFIFMRNDSLDRFGTRLEKRFTKTDITRMMATAGLNDIRLAECEPYWCAIGYKPLNSVKT